MGMECEAARKAAAAAQQDCSTQAATHITKPAHGGPEKHDQYMADPLAHFMSVPWTARLLTDPRTFGIVVSDRSHLPSGSKQFVRCVMSSEKTVRACVTFFRTVPVQPPTSERPAVLVQDDNGYAQQPLSRSKALLGGGGPDFGETADKPFLLVNALLDLGEDLCGYKGTLHGGALAVMLDETMCSAADNQDQFAFTVTATMTTTFLKPIKLPGIVLVQSRVVKREGRKVWVRGAIEDANGNLMAEAEAMLVDKTALTPSDPKL
ncbi:hypothetical protein N0V88_003004 [Collariella sp. IMI 366227]|nr:hypothetical protein N0V88_003004 [Collariella sp. IMI 366227]